MGADRSASIRARARRTRGTSSASDRVSWSSSSTSTSSCRCWSRGGPLRACRPRRRPWCFRRRATITSTASSIGPCYRPWRRLKPLGAERTSRGASPSELGIEGLLAVELFVLRDGRVLVNELAPRPHNTFHSTERGCATSQFEQLVRAVCDLPLGSVEVLRPAAIANLLGDLWESGQPDFAASLAVPAVRLHLYGKASARPGRKMGHFRRSERRRTRRWNACSALVMPCVADEQREQSD